MNYYKSITVLFLALLMLPCSALAVNTVLTGEFDGSENSLPPLPGTCGGSEPLRYREAGSFQVATSGLYTVADAFNVVGLDVSALIYQGSFNPNAPATNLRTPDGVDEFEEVNLNAGTNYILVVQLWCGNPSGVWVNREGAWSVTFSGPGEVTSSLKVAVLPAITEGVFTASDPVVESECGTSQYQQSEAFQVARSGAYSYADISIYYDIDVCLQVFTAPFDPDNPLANRISLIDDFGEVELQAGTDYYFVAQPLQSSAEGEFFYILAPPAPFRINKALAGSWYYPPTSGQGFFIDVFDNSNQMFLAWFTYDLERPDGSIQAMIGEPGHRWMTALGPFSGDTANLTIYWANGMVFDSADPPVVQAPDGSMTVKFNGCSGGTVDYDLGTNNVTGQVPIEPLAPDLIDLCETLTEGPGQPGPL